MSDGTLTPYAEVAQILDSLPLLLREARRARGLSLRAAAKQIGVSFATVGRMEAGEGRNVETTLAVLRWLDARPTPDEKGREDEQR